MQAEGFNDQKGYEFWKIKLIRGLQQNKLVERIWDMG